MRSLQPLRSLLLLLCVAAGSAAAQTSSVQAELQLEPPRLKALIEHGLSQEQLRSTERNDAQAYRLFCEAATYGSLLAHRLAAQVAVRHGAQGRAHALFHLQAARDLGSEQAQPLLASLLASDSSVEALTVHGRAALEPSKTPFSTPVCLSGGTETFIAGPVLAQRLSQGSAGDTFDLQRYLANAPASKRELAELVQRIAKEMSVDPGLALAIAAAESNFDAQARSPRNAQGVMQLIPSTAQRFGVVQPFDAAQNIRGGVAYLKWLQRYFNGEVEHVIAAYNAGEGAVKRHGGIPPYAETTAYVRRVLQLMRPVVP